MIFASPDWLFGLLILPVVALLEVVSRKRDAARTARLVARPLWPRVVRRPAEGWRRLRLLLLLAAGAGIVLALARPQWGIVREKVEREGVDVVLLIDASGSMATEDVPPNRFFLARQALASLVSRLEGDRFALVAFESEAYPLVPLTLDADALGLFLDTLEPGIVPAPGTSLGVGLARGLELFVDKERRNKVMVLVSDGEDLEGEIDAAVRKAKEAGVVVHTVGVGTEAGQPVPDFDKEGRRTGFKRDESGQAVISRLNPASLDAIARGTGGRSFRITPADTSLGALAAAIEGMEQKTLLREFSYRRKERFQVPLAVGLVSLALALLLPLPRLRREKAIAKAAALAALALTPVAARAQVAPPSTIDRPAPAPPASPAGPRSAFLDELFLRPRRLTEEGRQEYGRGNHPQALSAFEGASAARPGDAGTRFNMADALYKNGKFDEAGELFKALGQDPKSPLAGPARFNLGNALYQKKDYPNAVQAYKDALRVKPEDADTRKNLELALRALREQEEQKKRQQQNQPQKQDKKDDRKQKPGEQNRDGQKQTGQQSAGKDQGPPRPQTEQEKADQRFRQETGMPRERAMQLLEALQENEKAEQKKRLAAQRAVKKGTKDW
jgi:Ca-activated chloride channel homolog